MATLSQEAMLLRKTLKHVKVQQLRSLAGSGIFSYNLRVDGCRLQKNPGDKVEVSF